jgi:hypothetical protein
MRRKMASSSASRLTVTRLRPASRSACALRSSKRAVGGQRDVQRLAVRRAQRGQLGDQHFQVLAQQRLAAGQAQLDDAVRHEQARGTGDLFEAEQRAVRQEAVVAVEDFLGHAVAAAEVAAVRHRDAQVAQRPAQAVGQQAGGGCGRRPARRALRRRSARSAKGMMVSPMGRIVPPATALSIRACSTVWRATQVERTSRASVGRPRVWQRPALLHSFGDPVPFRCGARRAPLKRLDQ